MGVDEAGCHHAAAGINHLFARQRGKIADGGNLLAFDTDGAGKSGSGGAAGPAMGDVGDQQAHLSAFARDQGKNSRWIRLTA